MRIIRFTHFFNWLRIPKTLPFLFLPNANLNLSSKTSLFWEKSPSLANVYLYEQRTDHTHICNVNTLHHRAYITATDRIRTVNLLQLHTRPQIIYDPRSKFAVWLRDGRLRADGWLYLSNFSCSFFITCNLPKWFSQFAKGTSAGASNSI